MVKDKPKLAKPIEINGKRYYTLSQFAGLTGKSTNAIRHKVKRAKVTLKHAFFNGTIYILASELTNYVWKFPGRGKMKYKYNEKGEKIIIKES